MHVELHVTGINLLDSYSDSLPARFFILLSDSLRIVGSDNNIMKSNTGALRFTVQLSVRN